MLLLSKSTKILLSYTMGSSLVMSKLPKFVLVRYGIVLDVRYLFLGII